jgi:hypothetical protein
MKGTILMVFVCALLFTGCGEGELTEAWMQKEIMTWWGAKEIDAVFIEDYLEEDSVLTVLARLVVDDDTTVRMSYEFRRFKKAWRMFKGPVDDKVRELCIQELAKTPMQQAREAVLKANAANLRSVLEMYYATLGSYPSHIAEGDSLLSDELRGYFMPGVKNPYVPGQLPYIDARGDTSEWFGDYVGKVVYFPWVETDGSVSYYLLRLSTGMGFMPLVMGRWPASEGR